jgi:dihydrofolate synthase/folylpolyglutamate synthase
VPDGATSTSPAVQAQLDRLFAHGPGTDTLGLNRITRLLAQLGDPHRHVPPVFHVAGTNGKGSTCAFLRAALEAAGHRVHVYTSPHLVRFNERIRLAGRLIEDDALASLLTEVLDAGEDLNASFFEVTTAATLLAFARTPADACVVEVGLGGRLDATNVIPAPVVCGIAGLGLDHEAFLLAYESGTPADPLARIAWEKAGIAKPGVPLVTMAYAPAQSNAIAAVAQATGAPLFRASAQWQVQLLDRSLRYKDRRGYVALPPPGLVGSHQADNAGLAVAMLRHQQSVPVGTEALARALRATRWPARMQRLSPGPLRALVPSFGQLWVDGAHNVHAATAVADALAGIAEPRALTLVLGMLASKDAAGVLAALGPRVGRVIAVPTPGHAHHAPQALADHARDAGVPAATAADLPEALTLADTPVVLIAGSLYLAGEALRLNDELPD